MNANKRNILITCLLFVLFFVYTVLVMVVDLGEGLNGTTLGFSTLNWECAKVFPYNELWYECTEVLGYAAFGVCFGFALFGLFQMIKGKGFRTVDKKLYALAGLYAAVAGVYAAFEVFTINFRPVIVDGELEASFPSTHTLIGTCVFISATILFEYYLKNKTLLKAILQALCIVMALFMVIGRILSGVHWITDIFGGIILSAALLTGFYSVVSRIESQNE